MNKEEPKVLTRMRLSCCWGDNLNEKELNEVVDYINLLQAKVNQLETNIDDAIGYIKYCQTSDKDIFPVIEAEKMIEILERGKE